MTDFDLGDPAPDADDEPEVAEEPKEPESTESATETEGGQSDSRSVSDVETASRSERSGEERTPTRSNHDSSDDRGDEPEPGEIGPAFDYSEVRQNPLYARGKTWDELEDQLGITLTPKFREEGVRDDQLREVHDALLEVALEHIDEVSDRVLEKRVKSYNNEEF